MFSPSRLHFCIYFLLYLKSQIIVTSQTLNKHISQTITTKMEWKDILFWCKNFLKPCTWEIFPKLMENEYCVEGKMHGFQKFLYQNKLMFRSFFICIWKSGSLDQRIFIGKRKHRGRASAIFFFCSVQAVLWLFLLPGHCAAMGTRNSREGDLSSKYILKD